MFAQTKVMEDDSQQLRNSNNNAAASSEIELIKVSKLLIEPGSGCPLSAPLALTVKYMLTGTQPIKAAFWTLNYEADISMKRHVIPLFTTSPPQDLQPGEHIFEQKIDQIPTEGVKEKYLLQVGMLKLELRSASTNPTTAATKDALVSINMVTQVAKDDKGVLIRNIMSPLED